jgi:alpha-mannosidase
MKQWSVLLTLVFLVFGSGAAFSDSRTAAVLNDVESAVNTDVSGWSASEDAGAWQPYSTGHGLGSAAVRLKASVPDRKVLAGVVVEDAPRSLRFEFSACGRVKVNVLAAGKSIAAWTLDGADGRTVEETHEVQLPAGGGKAGLEIVLDAVNEGFNPPRGEFLPKRQKPLKEEGIAFTLRSARVLYPSAEAALTEVRNWLTSMRVADGLIHPELTRHTFTGIPYPMEDHRGVDAGKQASLDRALDAALGALDAAALKKGGEQRLMASIADSYARAGELAEYAKGFHITLLGNAHIDIAWLWRMAETVQVARNTFDTVMKNMDEYPELIYAQSQAVTYQWMEERYPDIFRRIQQKVREGRWEIVGGMWVEPDCNLISGESWVRQLLFGKSYFKDKFGVDVRVGWNPDSFGYNGNMPQIYRKSGIDAFITQKLWWNDTTVFPHFLFWWQGVDGTKLLTYLPPLSYDSEVRWPEVLRGAGWYQAATGRKDPLILFGLGDHGGGPNREILDRVRGYAGLKIAPEFHEGKMSDYLAPVLKDGGPDLPVWNNELYLQYHQGTFTTQAAIKKANRLGESGINVAEKLASIASLQGEAYPAGELRAAWTTLLTNQFHDILPGSGINAVYRDALDQHARARARIRAVAGQSMTALAADADKRRITGTPVVVFNPLAWERTDLVTLKTHYPRGQALRVHDPDGNEIPCESGVEGDDDTVTVRFVAERVPSLGWAVYGVDEGQSVAAEGGPRIKGTTLENDALHVEVDPATGNIRSLVDRRRNREFVAEGKQANVLWVYEDRPENWDAWNIGYTGRGWELNRVDATEVVRATPLRVTLRVKKSFLGLTKDRYSPTENFPSSFFSQEITLYRGLDRVDIATEADWWEDHLSLKAVFPLRVTADQANFEIPFGAVARSTKSGTPAEKAAFEVPALRWADLSDAAGGMSLINDGKQGYDVHGSTMKLSLLRSPTWPDPMADRGHHSFTYALYPHAGGFADGGTVRRAMEFNMPLIAVEASPAVAGIKPHLHERATFFDVEGTNVILDTMKKAENGDGLILRFYESGGKPGKGAVTFRRFAKKVEETDLMENTLKEIPIVNGRVELDFAPYEIRTLHVYYY